LILETNDDTISVEDAACGYSGYKGLIVIERCFRSLKRTQIRCALCSTGFPRRIEAHAKLSVLSFCNKRDARLLVLLRAVHSKDTHKGRRNLRPCAVRSILIRVR